MDPRAELHELKRGWQPPEELRRSRPRSVRLKAGGKALVAISALLLAASISAGILLYIKASADQEQRQQILLQGRDLDAQVVRRWATRGNDKRYYLEYAYTVDDEIYRGRTRIGRGNYNRLTPGSALRIRYLPADPRVHFVPAAGSGPMPIWLPYAVAVALAVGSLLVLQPLRAQRRLISEGRPARAVVSRIEKTSHGEVAHYEYSLLSGATAKGKSGPAKKQPPPGSVLCVVYEPDRSRNNAVYPLSLVRADFQGRPLPRAD